MAIPGVSRFVRMVHNMQASMMGPHDLLWTVRTGEVHVSPNVWVRNGQPASEGLRAVAADRLSHYVATAPLVASLNIVRNMDDESLVRCARGVLVRLPVMSDRLGSSVCRRIAHTIATDQRTHVTVQLSAAMYLVGELSTLELAQKVAVVVVAQRIAAALRLANQPDVADALLRNFSAQLLSDVAALPNPDSALSAALASDGDGPLPPPDDGQRRFG